MCLNEFSELALAALPAETRVIGGELPDSLKDGSNSRRQPTDKAHLPARFAPLTAVGEEFICGAAGTRTKFVQLFSRHAGGAKNVAIEPAQINE